MNEQPTFRERLAAVETDIKYIRENIAAAKEIDKRVSRLEQLGAAVTTVFTLVAFYFKNLVKS